MRSRLSFQMDSSAIHPMDKWESNCSAEAMKMSNIGNEITAIMAHYTEFNDLLKMS